MVRSIVQQFWLSMLGSACAYLHHQHIPTHIQFQRNVIKWIWSKIFKTLLELVMDTRGGTHFDTTPHLMIQRKFLHSNMRTDGYYGCFIHVILQEPQRIHQKRAGVRFSLWKHCDMGSIRSHLYRLIQLLLPIPNHLTREMKNGFQQKEITSKSIAFSPFVNCGFV